MNGSQLRLHQPGFTYIGLLIGIAIISAVLAATTAVWHTTLQREREKELLFIGSQFRQALARYAANTPPTAAGLRHPKRLEDLLLDDRYPGRCRYLRKIFVDPMTGRADWGLLIQPDGQIFGVHSLSEDEPIKKAGFRRIDDGLADKVKYSEWTFMHIDKPSPSPALGAPQTCQ